MAAWLANNPRPHGAVHLIYGCRTQGELLYKEELDSYTSTIPGFHYHPTLSREQWDRDCGYVHPIYERLCEERQPAQFMLCGWKNMIDEAKERILAMGYEKKQIHLELYG
jgi:CDP-4-dehydro-6-deoxyglucose reductase